MSADSVVYVRFHFTDDAYSFVLEVGTQIHLFVPWLGDPELAEYIDSRLPPSPLQTAGIPSCQPLTGFLWIRTFPRLL